MLGGTSCCTFSHGPQAATAPPCITATRSTCGRPQNCSWWVANTTAAPRESRWHTAPSHNNSPVCASHAAKISSRNTASANAHSARASATLAFCPPERHSPPSPTRVSSPSFISFKSGPRHDRRIASWYRRSNSSSPPLQVAADSPNRMFSRMVPCIRKGFCGTYARERVDATAPLTGGRADASAARNVDFPAPTAPHTRRHSPRATSKETTPYACLPSPSASASSAAYTPARRHSCSTTACVPSVVSDAASPSCAARSGAAAREARRAPRGPRGKRRRGALISASGTALMEATPLIDGAVAVGERQPVWGGA
mmetsp:Transcript_17778/g.42581  ORF Transcript_17778/g.42581 Transcript_17778/m.42581 type:complete len:313 (-) Transcript_17778:1387-2325(-)